MKEYGLKDLLKDGCSYVFDFNNPSDSRLTQFDPIGGLIGDKLIVSISHSESDFVNICNYHSLQPGNIKVHSISNTGKLLSDIYLKYNGMIYPSNGVGQRYEVWREAMESGRVFHLSQKQMKKYFKSIHHITGDISTRLKRDFHEGFVIVEVDYDGIPTKIGVRRLNDKGTMMISRVIGNTGEYTNSVRRKPVIFDKIFTMHLYQEFEKTRSRNLYIPTDFETNEEEDKNDVDGAINLLKKFNDYGMNIVIEPNAGKPKKTADEIESMVKNAINIIDSKDQEIETLEKLIKETQLCLDKSLAKLKLLRPNKQ